MTTHTLSPEDIMAFLDNQFTPSEAQAIAAHLQACSDCSALADDLRRTSETLASWKVHMMPLSLEASILGAIPTGKHPRRSTPNPWVLAVTGAAAVLIALFLSVRTFGTAQRNQAYLTARPSKSEQLAFVDIPKQQRAVGEGLLSNSSTPLIARTANLTITVPTVTSARQSLNSMLVRHQGYAAQLTVSTPLDAPHTIQASLRIPAAQLDAALADLKSLGKTEIESQSGEEVTQQHADLEARLKTARETETRFQEILQQRTGSVTEILEVEENIARVRGEIERMESDQKALDHRIQYASIELTLTEQYKSASAGALAQMQDAFAAGYHHASTTLLGAALFFTEYGPTTLMWLAIFLIPIYVVYRLRR